MNHTMGPIPPAMKALVKYLVFADEAGQRGNPGDREAPGGHRPERDRDFGPEAAAYGCIILLAVQGVDDRSGGEEEQRLEKCMGHQVEDGGGI